MTAFTGSFCIPATHPSLAGHFPGDPIVPGVVLLDETLACLPPGLSLLTAKFVEPVRPGQTVTVEAVEENGRVRITCFIPKGARVLHAVARTAG